MAESLHKAHRERMRRKYQNGGRDAMPDHELLELLLFSAIPRRNTNEIAHRLLATFGSLDGVIHATPEQLCRIEGIGREASFFLTELPYFIYRAEAQKTKRMLIRSLEELGHFLISQFRGIEKETVLLLTLDNAERLLKLHKVCEGTVNSSALSPRKIAELAFEDRAAGVILAHNHPGGVAEPSDEDVTTTRFLRRALAMIDLPLDEHIIVAGDSYYPIVTEMDRQAAFRRQQAEEAE